MCRARERLPTPPPSATYVSVKVEIGADGSIRIQDPFVFLRRSLLVASVLFVGVAAMTFFAGPDRIGSALGPLVGAASCVALAAIVEDSDFRFDAGKREVCWKKSRLFGGRGGTIPFADVDDIVLEVRTTRSDSGLSVTKDWRVLVVTRAGTMSLGSSNLRLVTARDSIAVPLLALLGKNHPPGERGLIVSAAPASGREPG